MFYVAEIKEILKNQLSDEFIRYLNKSPGSVKNIIRKWAIENDVSKENKVILSDIVGIEYEEEKQANLEIDESASTIDEYEILTTNDDLKITFVQEEGVIDDSLDKDFEPIEEAIDEQLFSGDFEPEFLEEEEDDDTETSIDNEESDNYYENYDFKDRIATNTLIAYISSNTKCKKHDTELKPIQVVLEYDEGRKYSINLNCCSKCKKLFISKNDSEEIKDFLERKNIDYRFL